MIGPWNNPRIPNCFSMSATPLDRLLTRFAILYMSQNWINANLTLWTRMTILYVSVHLWFPHFLYHIVVACALVHTLMFGVKADVRGLQVHALRWLQNILWLYAMLSCGMYGIGSVAWAERLGFLVVGSQCAHMSMKHGRAKGLSRRTPNRRSRSTLSRQSRTMSIATHISHGVEHAKARQCDANNTAAWIQHRRGL